MTRFRGCVCGAMLGAALLPGIAQAQSGYEAEIDAACAVYGCSTGYLVNVMMCESGGDPNAVGPNGELGIFQVQPAIWGVMSSSEQIWFAAQHLTAGDVYWVCA